MRGRDITGKGSWGAVNRRKSNYYDDNHNTSSRQYVTRKLFPWERGGHVPNRNEQESQWDEAVQVLGAQVQPLV